MKTKLIQGDYQVFEGRYNSQMPKLVQEGLTPLTVKDVMKYRLQAIQSKDKDEMNFWLNQYFDTVDGLAYHKGQLIVVPNSQELFNINQDSKFSNGSLILDDEQYKEISKKHEVIERNKIVSGKALTKEQVKLHPIWLKLAQEDKSLLNEYTDAIFAKAKEVYGYDENMGVYLPDDQEQPAMRDWCLRDLGGRSYASARDNLYSNCRLFGVRVQNLGSTLEKIAKEAKIMNPQEVRKALEFYKTAKQGSIDLKLLQ